MARLLSQNPCMGLLPRAIGGLTLSESIPGYVTLLELRRGGDVGAIERAHDLAWPTPGNSYSNGDTRLLWAGPNQAWLLGATPSPQLGEAFYLTDQSDAWACVVLSGDAADAALSRLVPIDLRASAFKQGNTARTLIGHMDALITRTGPDALELFVFRSMAATLVEELTQVMMSIAARRGLEA